MLERMHETSFNFENWNAGSLSLLNIPMRENCILNNLEIIKRYSIGFLEGDMTMCRPKPNTIAIMFLKDGIYFWTHFTIKEAKGILK